MAEGTIENNEGFNLMGMDVYGSSPDSKVGEYFRRNIWGWSALWGYCASVSMEAASLGIGAYHNDGEGLDATGAKKLAATLQEQLASGATKTAVKEIEELEIAPAMPAATEALIAKFHIVLPTGCPFSEDDVREFVEFLEHSGGFTIR
jgi:hypothetical protein